MSEKDVSNKISKIAKYMGSNVLSRIKFVQNLPSFKKYRIQTSIGYDNITNEFINKIRHCEKKDYDKITCSIRKIHSKCDYPLAFIALSKLGLAPNDIKEFVEWYTLNHHNIRMKRKVLDNKKIIDKDLDVIKDILATDEQEKKGLIDLLYDNSFVSLDIQHFAECHDLLCDRITFDKTNILIYHQPTQEPNIDRLVHICEFMRKISDFDGIINIIILYTCIKKEIHELASCITPMNVNSGSTLIGGTIYIWRKEEIEKVLIHELIHYTKMDNILIGDMSMITTLIMEMFTSTFKDGATEFYTEFMAIIIHSVFVASCWMNKKPELIKSVTDSLINIEFHFNMFQVAKIIYYCGGINFANILRPKGIITICQTSSVVSYFIIKTYMLMNINQILGTNEITFAKIKNVMLSLLTNDKIQKEYSPLIDENIKFIDDNIDMYDSIWTTLRMSCT